MNDISLEKLAYLWGEDLYENFRMMSSSVFGPWMTFW